MSGRYKILASHENNARGDHRLDNTIRDANDIKDRERQGNGMSESERGDHLNQVPDGHDRQDKTSDEQEVIVPAENVSDPVAEKGEKCTEI